MKKQINYKFLNHKNQVRSASIVAEFTDKDLKDGESCAKRAKEILAQLPGEPRLTSVIDW